MFEECAAADFRTELGDLPFQPFEALHKTVHAFAVREGCSGVWHTASGQAVRRVSIG